jgi:hypothetical protein
LPLLTLSHSIIFVNCCVSLELTGAKDTFRI